MHLQQSALNLWARWKYSPSLAAASPRTGLKKKKTFTTGSWIHSNQHNPLTPAEVQFTPTGDGPISIKLATLWDCIWMGLIVPKLLSASRRLMDQCYWVGWCGCQQRGCTEHFKAQFCCNTKLCCPVKASAKYSDQSFVKAGISVPLEMLPEITPCTFSGGSHCFCLHLPLWLFSKFYQIAYNPLIPPAVS